MQVRARIPPNQHEMLVAIVLSNFSFPFLIQSRASTITIAPHTQHWDPNLLHSLSDMKP